MKRNKTTKERAAIFLLGFIILCSRTTQSESSKNSKKASTQALLDLK